MVTGALAFAELGTVVPQSGAEYSYYRAAFSPLHKFLGPLPCFIYVWVMVLVLRPAEVAIVILTFSEYVYSPVVSLAGLQVSDADEEWIKRIIGVVVLGRIAQRIIR